MIGISFDSPTDNLAFRSENQFPFPLLSDVDRSVGQAYQVVRTTGDRFADYPQRVAYLIDPDGTIVTATEVTDPAGYGEQALADLAAAQR